jgi:hypothetical protein
MRTRLTSFAAIAALVLPLSLHAQITFQRTYGGAGRSIGYSVQQTRDGGYIVAGQTTPLVTVWPGVHLGSIWPDALLIKTTAHGETLWTRTYGGSRYDIAKSVRQTADGGYVVAGETNSFGAGESDIYLIRTDAHGDTLWTRTFGGEDGEDCNCVQQTTDGGYIMTGSAGYIRAGGGHDVTVHLTKADGNGRMVWMRTYVGAGPEDGHSVQQTADGGFIVAGYAWGPLGAGSDDVYLIKTDSIGDTLWTRTIGGSSWDMGHSIQQTADGGFIIAGETQSLSPGRSAAYLVKTDAAGHAEWTRAYGGPNGTEAHSIGLTADGGYIVVGLMYEPPKSSAVYVVKAKANGDTAWTRTFHGSGHGYSVQQTRDGGYVIAGSAGGGGVLLIKTDARGNVAVNESGKR